MPFHVELDHHPVHGLDEGVAAVIKHAAHDRFEVRLECCRQPLEGLQPTSPGPRQPTLEIGAGKRCVVVAAGMGEDLAQPHLQAPSGAIRNPGWVATPTHISAMQKSPAKAGLHAGLRKCFRSAYADATPRRVREEPNRPKQCCWVRALHWHSFRTRNCRRPWIAALRTRHRPAPPAG